MGYREDLVAEHREIERMLSIMDAMRLHALKGEPIPTADLTGVLDFIGVFIDACHHHKEEQMLFPAMEQAGVEGEGEPIGPMLTDHEAARKHATRLNQALAISKGDVFMVDDDDIRVMLAYTKLLHEHINTEDTKIFSLAERVLSDEVKDRLGKQFVEYERDVLGKGRHERFESMLGKMEQAYGVTVLA